MARSHPSKLLTLARDLRRKKARERQGLFVAEGIRTVEELLRSALKIRGILTSEAIGVAPRGAALRDRIGQTAVPVDQVSTAEFDSAAETDAPQGVLAIAEVPDTSLADIPRTDSSRLLVLDAVQDPGNVGTIVRTAAAFGVSATFSLPGTVDLWNAKVVRSGMGAHFHHPCVSVDWDQLGSFLRDRTVEVWAADAGGESVEEMKPPSRLAIVVGNEGAGLSSESRARADRLVALPIAAGVESLNVAVAAGILLYELRR